MSRELRYGVTEPSVSIIAGLSEWERVRTVFSIFYSDFPQRNRAFTTTSEQYPDFAFAPSITRNAGYDASAI